MRGIIVGVSFRDFSFQGKDGKPVSLKDGMIQFIRAAAKTVSKDGLTVLGTEVQSIPTDIRIAGAVFERMQKEGQFLVVNLDTDVAGTGDKKRQVATDIDILGVLSNYDFTLRNGLSPRDARPVSVPRPASVSAA